VGARRLPSRKPFSFPDGGPTISFAGPRLDCISFFPFPVGHQRPSSYWLAFFSLPWPCLAPLPSLPHQDLKSRAGARLHGSASLCLSFDRHSLGFGTSPLRRSPPRLRPVGSSVWLCVLDSLLAMPTYDLFLAPCCYTTGAPSGPSSPDL